METRHVGILKAGMLNLKRLVVVIGVVATIYTVVGSYLYGEWYFGLIWRAKALKLSYWLNGAQEQVETSPYSVIAVTIAVFLLSMFLYYIRQKFLPFVDKQWIWLCTGLAVVIFVTAVLVYKNDRERYSLLESFGTLTADLKNLQEAGTVSTSFIRPPIDFDFIDAPDIEAMYSQLGPDLVEQKRVVENTDSVSANAAVAVGSVDLGGRIGQDQKEKSEQERLAFTPERKCVDLMRYTLDHKIAHRYVDDKHWLLDQLTDEIQQNVAATIRMVGSREPVTKASLERLRLEPIPTSSEEISKEQQRQMTERIARLEDELKSLKGPIFVEGEFSLENGRDNMLVFIHEFSKKPHPIFFRVTAPNTLKLSQLTHKARIRAFGTVTSPLSDDGRVLVRAIAIF